MVNEAITTRGRRPHKTETEMRSIDSNTDTPIDSAQFERLMKALHRFILTETLLEQKLQKDGIRKEPLEGLTDLDIFVELRSEAFGRLKTEFQSAKIATK